jgi:Rrf2 family iron-sulfur cluster assembly transcriptional regulator
MIAPSKKIFYSIEAVLYIAYNSAYGPISSKEIAEKQGLPSRYLEQIMQRLVRAGILRGVRGPRGGYLLAKERRRITLAEICEVLDDDKDSEEDKITCTPLGHKIVMPLWQRLNDSMMATLREVNIAELCDQALAKNLRKHAEERVDFAI